VPAVATCCPMWERLPYNVASQKRKQSLDPAPFHAQPAAYISLAESEIRIKKQPPFQPFVRDPDLDRDSRSIAIPVPPSLRIDQIEVACADNAEGGRAVFE
jgi:hypothetical protein